MKYTIKEGDTLSEIARDKLGSYLGWTEIYKINKGVIGADPDVIKPGQEIDIPFDLIEFFKDLLKIKIF